MNNKLLIYVLMLCLFAACRPDITGNIDAQPDIFPDYKDVTIPCNIAPLNFNVLSGEGSKTVLLLTAGDETLCIRADDGLVSFRKGLWKRLLSENKGRELSLQVCVRESGEWRAYQPFSMHVAEDEIDPYLAYRLVPPGYSLWQEMSIRQRCLENFDEDVIYSNDQGKGNCVNCHSFCGRDADVMLMHMRSELAGTYVFRNGSAEKLDTKTDRTMSALVYPYWHDSGKYVAFSVNKTNQVLHASDPNRIEVFDENSDVVVYDVEGHEIVASDVLASETAFETFPSFSPDGRSLYFCTSDAVEPMPERYQEARYSLCRVEFNPDDCSVGSIVDTLYNAEVSGGSVSYPRISPDGRFLVFTLSGYGNFSIWHKDADLYCMDLHSRALSSLDSVNSNDVESYHSWSGNSRWLVVSSRRHDGLYTRPYISYVNADGKFQKPFMLPQKNPLSFYDSNLFSYNIPEFIDGKVNLRGRVVADFASDTEPVSRNYRKL